MDKKQKIEQLAQSIEELSEILPNSAETQQMQSEVAQLGKREDSIAKSHIAEDKEANALTMQIKIDGTALKGQTALQAFESLTQMSITEDKLLNNLMNVVQKKPPQQDEKIGQYFVRLADDDLIEIDDTIDHFINLFNI